MAKCEECLHYDLCEALERGNGIPRIHPKLCDHFKNKSDVVEVRHGRWHIMSEDPYDESDCPTEEGWYRIITTDGEEMTDYFCPTPTLKGMGCVTYWKNCKKIIRAWAKMDCATDTNVGGKKDGKDGAGKV